MAGKFLKVRCKCGEELMVYSTSSLPIVCPSCNEKILENTGGKAVILAEIIEEK